MKRKRQTEADLKTAEMAKRHAPNSDFVAFLETIQAAASVSRLTAPSA
jgi:hypothetical protein